MKLSRSYRLILTFLAVIVVSASSMAAGTTGTGKVKRINVKGNEVLFNLKEDSAQCSTSNSQWYSFDLTTEGSRVWYEMIMAAAYEDVSISVKISELCWTESGSPTDITREVLFITQSDFGLSQ